MALDPGLAGLLQAMHAAGIKDLAQADDPVAARRQFRAVTADIRPEAMVIPVGEVTDGSIPGPAGDLRIRTYRPADAAGSLPTILFLHGGGWVIGDLDTHDNQARRLCREVEAVVVSLEYRLAPENPFPAGVEDTWSGLLWVSEHIAELGGDAGRIAVAGDSAGATLAAVAARRSRDAGGPAVAAQLLIYPGTDFAAEIDLDPPAYPSRIENGEGKLLTAKDIVWFGSHYVGGAVDGSADDRLQLDLFNPDLSPLRTPDLSNMPTAIIVTGEFDPLRDEGEAYAAALDAAGSPVTLARMDGMIHGFFDLGPASPAVEAAVQRTCQLLKEALARSERA